MFQKYNKLVILDTETTGLDKDVNEIIEFAALVLNKQKDGKFKVNEEIDFFIQNEEPIPEPKKEWKSKDWIRKYVSVWFFGNLCKMMGKPNPFKDEYDEEMEKYTVKPPEEGED